MILKVSHNPSSLTTFFKSRFVVDEHTARTDARHDATILAALDALFIDDGLLDAIGQCLEDVPLSETLACATQLLRHRIESSCGTTDLHPWNSYRHMTQAGVMSLFRLLAQSLIHEINYNSDTLLHPLQPTYTHKWSKEMDEALYWLLEWADLTDFDSYDALYTALLGKDFTITEGVMDSLAWSTGIVYYILPPLDISFR